MTHDNREKLVADRIRKACIQAAKEGFRDASISGLCSEGAIEAAVSAIQSLDLDRELENLQVTEKVGPTSEK